MPGGLNDVDLIVTDPPYYDAIPYSDLMDFFYVWLAPSASRCRSRLLTPNVRRGARAEVELRTKSDGELIDDASRFGGDKALSKQDVRRRDGACLQGHVSIR